MQEVFPEASIQIDVEPSDNDDELRLVIEAAKGDAPAGIYNGFIRVRSPGVTSLNIPIKATVRGGTLWQALVVLGSGLVIGAILKWYADSGKRLGATARRYEALRIRLAGLIEDLPKSVRAYYTQLARSLAQHDADASEAALTALDANLDEAIQLAREADQLRDEIRQHERTVSSLRRKTLEAVGKLEERAVLRALGAKDLAAARAQLDTLRKVFEDVTQVLLTFPDPNPKKQLYEEARLADVLTVLEAAKAGRRATVALGAVAARTRTTAEKPPTRGSWTKFWTKVKGWLSRRWKLWFAGTEFIRNTVPWLIAILTLSLIALYGLQTQYYEKASFGAGGTGDWLTLFGWGVAATITGKTVGDFFGRFGGPSQTTGGS